APALTETVPISLPAGQLPAAAAGSPQSVTPVRFASIPVGSVACSEPRVCSPSARKASTARSVLAPAVVDDGFAWAAGAKGSTPGQAPPAPSWSTAKTLVGVAAACPE